MCLCFGATLSTNRHALSAHVITNNHVHAGPKMYAYTSSDKCIHQYTRKNNHSRTDIHSHAHTACTHLHTLIYTHTHTRAQVYIYLYVNAQARGHISKYNLAWHNLHIRWYWYDRVMKTWKDGYRYKCAPAINLTPNL